MKRLFLIGMMVLSAAAAFSQNAATVSNLKERQKALALASKLNKLQLDYEKKKAEHNALIEKVAALNAEANTTTTDFNTSDAAGTVKDVESTVKKLKAAKAANKKLAKSQKTLNKMEKGIVKLQDQIGDLDKKVRFVDQ